MPGRSASINHQPSDSLFFRDERLNIIDQRALPESLSILELETPEEVAESIRLLAVRGAMAMGVAGAYGVLLGALAAPRDDTGAIGEAARRAIRVIGASRPTAANLFWALDRMESVLDMSSGDDPGGLLSGLRDMADGIAVETMETNRKLVEAGQEIIGQGERVLTHCNSGPLAAFRYGTAVGVLIEAHRLGKGIHVFVDETRPLLQGARLTTWELASAGVPYTLIPDSAAGTVMRQGLIGTVITGADRIAANGDTANKIGTYSLAVLAGANGIPFYIAAPGSTVDLEAETGDDIVIEERDGDEVRKCGGRLVAPRDAAVYNPSFDVTPASLITGIVTERGILRPPYSESLNCFTA